MTKLIFIFIFGFFTLNIEAAEKNHKEPKDFHPNPLMVAEFMSNFKTIGEYLDALKDRSLISQFEQDAITQILKEKKISLTDELMAPKAEKGVLTWGKKSLTYEGNSTFKTQDGVYIRLDKAAGADQVFLKAFNALSNQKTSLLKSLLLNEAQAQNALGIRDALKTVGSALYTVGYHGIKSAATLGVVISGVVTNVFGGALEIAVVGIANFIYKGSIQCDDDLFFVNLGYDTTDGKREFEHAKSEYEYLGLGYSEVMSSFALVGYTKFGNAIVNGNKRSPDYISYNDKELLKSVFPEGIPKCNKENAKKVELALKEKAKKAEAQLEMNLSQLTAQKKLPTPAVKSKTNN